MNNQIDDKSEDPDDDMDDLSRVIGDSMDKHAGTDEDEAGGLEEDFAPEQIDAPEAVSQAEGSDIVNDARDGKLPNKNDETDDDADAEADKADDDKDEKAAAQDDKPDDAAAEDTEGEDKAVDGDDKAEDKEPVDLATATPDALLDGVPDDRKAEITKRLGAADGVMNLFTGREQALQSMGSTPQDAVQRMLELNDFAQSNPDEYLAWVATQAGGADPKALIEKAVGRLGLKVVPASVEPADGEFVDQEVLNLRAENERLKQAANGGSDFGPDTPQRLAQRGAQTELANFIAEVDDTGQLKRPHFKQLEARITQLGQAHVQTTRQPVAVTDLDRFYVQALQEAQAAFAPPSNVTQTTQPVPEQTSAAQGQASMQEQIQKQTDAAIKAQRASQSIDGTGQGTARQPALSANAPIDEVIMKYAFGDD